MTWHDNDNTKTLIKPCETLDEKFKPVEHFVYVK